jgi:hypothetical protein
MGILFIIIVTPLLLPEIFSGLSDVDCCGGSGRRIDGGAVFGRRVIDPPPHRSGLKTAPKAAVWPAAWLK